MDGRLDNKHASLAPMGPGAKLLLKT